MTRRKHSVDVPGAAVLQAGGEVPGAVRAHALRFAGRLARHDGTAGGAGVAEDRAAAAAVVALLKGRERHAEQDATKYVSFKVSFGRRLSEFDAVLQTWSAQDCDPSHIQS